MEMKYSGHTRAETTLRGGWLPTARTAWVGIAVLAVGLYIAALPYDHQELRRVCAGGHDCRVDVQLTAPDALALEDMGLSIGFYAGFFLSIEVIILVVFVVVPGVIFWRRSDDWMALFLSLTLLLLGLTLPAIMEQVEERVPALELVIDFLNHLSAASIVILLFLFPDGRFVPRWTRLVAIGFSLLSLLSFAVFIVPQGGGVPPGGNPLDDGLNRIIFLALPVGVLAQIYRYFRVADTVKPSTGQVGSVRFGRPGARDYRRPVRGLPHRPRQIVRALQSDRRSPAFRSSLPDAAGGPRRLHPPLPALGHRRRSQPHDRLRDAHSHPCRRPT